jgi:hypothetical protein
MSQLASRRRHAGPSHTGVHFLCSALISMLVLGSGASAAVEVLSIHELVYHCERLQAEPEGADAQYCVRYIQGFIDGAVATDARVMLNVEDEQKDKETFSERAKRTRMPNNADRFRAARLAGFCLGDPLPLREVVSLVVADLVARDQGVLGESPAREVVYESLMAHYPCQE